MTDKVWLNDTEVGTRFVEKNSGRQWKGYSGVDAHKNFDLYLISEGEEIYPSGRVGGGNYFRGHYGTNQKCSFYAIKR